MVCGCCFSWFSSFGVCVFVLVWFAFVGFWLELSWQPELSTRVKYIATVSQTNKQLFNKNDPLQSIMHLSAQPAFFKTFFNTVH